MFEFTLTRTGDEIRIEGGGYETEFTTEEIKSVEILQKEIGESFHRKKTGYHRTNIRLGHFKGSESGENNVVSLPRGYADFKKSN